MWLMSPKSPLATPLTLSVVIDGLEGPAFQDVLIDGAYAGQGM